MSFEGAFRSTLRHGETPVYLPYNLKFIKYILPSSKDCTGVGLLGYRDVYWHSASISREKIEVLYIELVLKTQTQLQQRLTAIKEPPLMTGF